MSAPTNPAGWYPDPRGRADHRYWDGKRWTDQISRAGITGTDPLDPPPGAADRADDRPLPTADEGLPAKERPKRAWAEWLDRRSFLIPNALWVVLAGIGVLSAIGLISNATEDGGDGSEAVEYVLVTYKVTGTATSADITLSTENGGTSQQSEVDVPLRNKSGTSGLRFVMGPGSFAYISAQNNGYGTITCSIEIEGIEVVSNTSSGEFAIATCDTVV